MTIFAILITDPTSDKLVSKIKAEYPLNYFNISDTQWLISADGTPIDMCVKLGIYDTANPAAPHTGNAVVVQVASYFGRAPKPIWDWITAKLESRPHG